MNTVNIFSKIYVDNQVWAVVADVKINGHSYGGPHTVLLPETATDDDIKKGILSQYGVK
jgi:hypothetical protein